jgi:hypothetical protein
MLLGFLTGREKIRWRREHNWKGNKGTLWYGVNDPQLDNPKCRQLFSSTIILLALLIFLASPNIILKIISLQNGAYCGFHTHIFLRIFLGLHASPHTTIKTNAYEQYWSKKLKNDLFTFFRQLQIIRVVNKLSSKRSIGRNVGRTRFYQPLLAPITNKTRSLLLSPSCVCVRVYVRFELGFFNVNKETQNRFLPRVYNISRYVHDANFDVEKIPPTR